MVARLMKRYNERRVKIELKHMYKNSRTTVIVEMLRSEWFNVNFGVHQG